MAKRIKVAKTRNANTMSESEFWSFIRSTLRRASRYWKPIQQCKQGCKQVYKGDNKRQKYEYVCNECGKAFSDKEIEINHIVEVGSLKSGDDLKGFVDRLFTEDLLECICKPCHLIKTNNYRNENKRL